MRTFIQIAACSLTTVGVFAQAPATTLSEAFSQGKVSLNLRARYEGVQQTGLRDAHAVTLSTRLGFATARLHGFQAFVQAEDVSALDGDDYSQAGLNPGGAGRAVVADPEDTEINQVWLGFQSDATTAVLGRQMLVYDNQRFIGNVGWRQNMQAFDAVSLKVTPSAAATVSYAYLDRIHRVFTNRHPQGNWQSDSHLLNASYKIAPAATVGAYAYLLEFGNAAANSSATYGAFVAGASTIAEGVKASYRAEYARQRDYGNQPADYATDYYLLEAGVGVDRGGIAIGHEVLGSDSGVGFKTPLATLHAFNGWADLFLATPAAGLEDTFIRAQAKGPAGVDLLAFYHWFSPERGGGDYGREFDLQLSRKFTPNLTGLIKYADFHTDSALPDVTKFWVQVEFTY